MVSIGIIFARKIINIWDLIGIIFGGVFTVLFIVSLIFTHRIKQIQKKPNQVDMLIKSGLYSLIRHPNYMGIILMNFAYLLFFRTYWLIPLVIFFIILWYLEARVEERILISEFGDQYLKYKSKTVMFFPRFIK
jgi:protein-S-isoprenylcysteine O-methyltransferase Ste14